MATTTETELDSLPDSAFLAGLDQIVGAGTTFRLGAKILTCVGFQVRPVWDDSADQWVKVRAAGCRPATRDEIVAAGLDVETCKVKGFAIKGSPAKGNYYAIAGKRGGHAIAKTAERATIFATREEAEAATASISASSPAFLGSPEDMIVVEVN
jgi:hypothetical protein